MAQPANLKKLARERMARTGESYTTARKNILTGKPESPKAARAAVARDYAKEAREAKAKGKAAKPAPAPLPAAEELPEYPAPEDVIQYDAALWHRVFVQGFRFVGFFRHCLEQPHELLVLVRAALHGHQQVRVRQSAGEGAF